MYKNQINSLNVKLTESETPKNQRWRAATFLCDTGSDAGQIIDAVSGSLPSIEHTTVQYLKKKYRKFKIELQVFLFLFSIFMY
jgi:hypothetical protein